MKISELFDHYGSDKNAANGYGPAYDKILEGRRESVEAVLEIGVHQGASLRAWRDFFPNALVLGFDVNPTNEPFAESRVHALRVNACDLGAVDRALGDRCFDLIVDDGSHNPLEQAVTLTFLWRRVVPGGFYVVEDLLSKNAMDYLVATAGFLGGVREGTAYDFQKATGRQGAILFVFEKESYDGSRAGGDLLRGEGGAASAPDGQSAEADGAEPRQALP